MGLGNLLKNVAAVGLFVAKVPIDIVAGVVGEGIEDVKKAQDVRRNASGMNDRDLIRGAQDTHNSWSTRVGLAQQYKDRHGR